MSCIGCLRKYGLFCRESGCPSCGFSYCSKCLKKSIQIPKLNNEKKKVCLSCFDKLTKEALTLNEKPPVQDVIKMLENLDDKDFRPPITVYTATKDEDANQTNEIDENIRTKLKSLRDDGEAIPQDKDIAIRLAKLKDIEFKEKSNMDLITAVDNRTDVEKANDLMKQYMEEQVIANSDSNPIADIEMRLAALKDVSVDMIRDQSLKTESDSSDDDEKAEKKVLKKYMEEAALNIDITPEEKEIINDLPPPSKDTEELPWCAVCNEDAIKRCDDCDGELYCEACFKDIHDDDEEYKSHKTKPYKSPKTTVEDNDDDYVEDDKN